ncbi:MAG: DUF4920 domain-containing protein [Bacteroidota bacterium]
MKNRFLMVVGVILIPLLFAAAGDKKYGKPLTLKKATPIAELLAKPEAFKDKTVMLEGEITEVCQKKGCWIKVKDSSSDTELQVKVEDDVIVFPKDGKGKKVRAEGVVSVSVLTEEERRSRAEHEAEEQGTLKEFDPSKIVGSVTIVRIEGEGAVLVDE